METKHGQCLCGAVRFRTHGELRDVVYCHCSQCRRQTGLYYAATRLPLDRIQIEGENEITWYAASPTARRGFCRTCGSALFWKRESGDAISVLAGAFDDPSGLHAGMHIFTGDKGDFYAIADGLPQHPASTRDIPVGDQP